MDFIPNSVNKDNLQNMLYITLTTTLTSTIISIIMKAIELIINIFCETIKKIFNYIINLKNKLYNEIIIDNNYQNPNPNINNALLIEAILSDVNKGSKYKLENYVDFFNNKISNNLNEKEKNRKLKKKINETFKENGIYIKHEIINKTTVIDKGSNKKEEKEIPNLERLTLSSLRNINYIQNYIEEKKIKYINATYPKDDKLYIYYPTEYQNNHVVFSKILFSSKKTFKNWFSPEKGTIIRILNDFKNKKGIYSLETTVYKLGFLLHGEPGCGKTSLIKILANELERCIIIISLDKFKNYESLRNLFFNDSLLIVNNNGVYYWDFVPLNKRIIVFEEIDTSGSIVMDRNKLKIMIKNKSLSCENAYFSRIMDTYKKNLKDSEIDSEKKANDCDVDEDLLDKALYKSHNLTLGNILELLDGLCEIYDIVYVMTTNHMDLLDPALIRSGRITYSLKMENLKYNELKEMFEYYFIHENKSLGKSKIITYKKYIDEICRHYDGSQSTAKIEEICKNNSREEIYEMINNK